MSQPKHPTRTLLLCGLLHAFTHLYQVALVPLYLLIQQDLKLATVSSSPLLVTCMGLAYFLPSYWIGTLADSVSRKKMLWRGLALNGLGFVLLSLAPNYLGALAAVLVAGFGGSFFHPAATSLIARLYPLATGRALGLSGIGASVGFFVGPIYSGWRAISAGSWRVPVLEIGMVGIAGAALFAWLAEEEPAAKPPKSAVQNHNGVFASPVTWIFFVFASFALSLRDFAGNGMSSLTSLFLQNAYGFDARKTGFVLSLIFIFSAISNPLIGALSDQGRKRWSTGVLIIASTMACLVPRVSPQRVPILLGVYGFFFMASYPVVEAALMESVADRVRGRIFGFFITIGGLFGNLAHWVLGSWVAKLGPAAQQPESFYPIYGLLGLFILASLLGLPSLAAMRHREQSAASLIPIGEAKFRGNPCSS